MYFGYLNSENYFLSLIQKENYGQKKNPINILETWFKSTIAQPKYYLLSPFTINDWEGPTVSLPFHFKCFCFTN